MSECIQNNSDMSEEALLLQSCELYQEIERLYLIIGSAISKASPRALKQATLQLNQLVNRAKVVDHSLAETLTNKNKRSEDIAELIARREEILRALVNRNRSITQKAGNITSHLRHEIGSMKTNRTAMKGYKPAAMGQTRKSMINNSF